MKNIIIPILLIAGFSSRVYAQLPEVKKGAQTWMTYNLNVDKFRNGDIVPEVKSKEDWEKACKEKKPAWCYYNNDAVIGNEFGKLYNLYAISDPRGLAPIGWHVATDEEWTALIKNLGNQQYEIVEKFTEVASFTDDGKMVLGFNGKPGGARILGRESRAVISKGAGGVDGTFWGMEDINKHGSWWTSSVFSTQKGGPTDVFWCRSFATNSDNFNRHSGNYTDGMYVRCVKD